MENEQQAVHIFSVHEPGSRSSTYVLRPVAPGKETLTNEEILHLVDEVQKNVGSATAVVNYFALARKDSVR